MKQKKLTLYFPFILFLATLLGCLEEDFSVDPKHTLSFSTDSVKFDTLFTETGSATYRLMIYNRNAKPIRISTIKLAGGENSYFYLNVDGMQGREFKEIEMRSKDSIFVFIEVKINPNNAQTPFLIKDSLLFNTNGKQQEVKLEAYGQNCIRFKGKTFDKDTTLTSILPYLITDSMVIAEGVELTIESGTKLHFHNNAMLKVAGKITGKGRLTAPIIMQGDRLDYLFPTLPYAYLAGQWKGICFTEKSYNNSLEYTQIKGTVQAIKLDSGDYKQPKLKLINSIIHNASGNLISSHTAQIEAANSQFSNAGGAILEQCGGKSTFTHCTFANYYAFGITTSPMIIMRNYQIIKGEEYTAYPIYTTSFNNCIIYGNNTDLMINDHKTIDIPLELSFNYCLFKSREKNERFFNNCIWNTNPLFKITGKDYLYDFRIDSLSPARGVGDKEYSLQYPTDMNNNSRITEEGADLGAYQFVTTPQK